MGHVEAADFVTLSHVTTSQQVADGIRDMILSGALLPGERINESTMSTSLGISRNTVREAVRLLEAGGLIRQHQRRGMAVWDPSDEEILDLYAARLHLECLAARAVGPETDLSAVKRALEDFREVLGSHDPTRIVEADLALHQTVIDLLGNAYLSGVYKHLSTQLRYFLLVLSIDQHEYEDVSGIEQEHISIVEALESRDAAVAENKIAAIINENRDLVRQSMQIRRSAQATG
ncbi:hypothetical protein BVC93_24755 [Mycobacterium sp. MS1601]|nr:hypothetical protein BVC93_24755 [Mycobacterium sp. MS1601]